MLDNNSSRLSPSDKTVESMVDPGALVRRAVIDEWEPEVKHHEHVLPIFDLGIRVEGNCEAPHSDFEDSEVEHR